MDPDAVQRLRAAVTAASRTEPVRFAYLFGSRARGHPRPSSDTDIAVYLADGVPPDDRFAVGLRLAGRQARDAGGEVDVVVLNDAPLPLLGSILRQRIVLFSIDEPLRVAFESTAFRLFTDFEPRLLAMSRSYLAAAARGPG